MEMNERELNEQELDVVNGGAATKGYVTYTVVKGDNLHKIAAKFNTTWGKIYDLNKAVIGADPDKIYPGQILKIPQ